MGIRISQKKIRLFSIYTILIICSMIAIFPIIWLLLTSFKTNADSFAQTPVWFFKPTLEHWIKNFTERGFFRLTLNSLIVCTSSVIISFILGLPAAYGLSRFRIKGKENLLFWILSLRFLPPIAVVIPLFIFLRNFRMTDTYQGLIIMYVLLNLPLTIWLMKGYFEELPVAVEEAAKLDGCSNWGVLLRVAIPMATPGIVATGILNFILSWNEFLFAFILTRETAKTLPVGAVGILTDRAIFWGEISAAGVSIMAPMIILSLLVSKHLARSLTFGAVK